MWRAFVFACTVCVAAVLSAEADWTRIYLGEDPAVTPDGSAFYFTWNDHIWQAPTAGGQARLVSAAAARESSPVLSRDGSRLAFVSDCEGTPRVYECPTAGGPVRPLTFHSELTRPWCYTPNGNQLICTALRDQSGAKTALRLIRVPTRTSGPEHVLFDTQATAPSLSPDGKSVLFVRGAGSKGAFRKRRGSTSAQKGEIWRYDFPTKKFTCVVSKEMDVRDPVWAPDGRSFYYLSMEKGIRNLARRTLADGADTILTQFTDEHVERPSISADGKTAVFSQGFDFWRLDLAAAAARPEKIVLHPERGYVARPTTRRRVLERISNVDESGDATFCSDGLQVAFTAGGVLWVMDTELRQPRRIDGGGTVFVRECVFSPDGDCLYYIADRGDGSDLRVARRTDATRGWWENEAFACETRVSDDEVRTAFSLSPDGTKLAWQDPRGRLAFAGTNGVVTARGPTCLDAGGYAWSPDGKWMAAAYGDLNGNQDVWIISVDGSREPYNVSRNFLWDGSPAWSPDGKLLAFIGQDPESSGSERLYYVYLNKADEARETFDKKYEEARKKVAGVPPAKPAATNATAKVEAPVKKPEGKKADEKKPVEVKIDFDGLCERVHQLAKTPATDPFFSHDGRTLAFASGGKTMKVHVPDKMEPQKLFDKTGAFRGWIAKGDRVLRLVNGHPAHGDTEFAFKAHVSFAVADWQELGFRTAWGRIRDRFYDENLHGADWPALKARYLAAARQATSYATFKKVVEMMLGELDASHLGLLPTAESSREWAASPAHTAGWNEQTAYLGLRFAPNGKQPGWRVREVVKDGPADRSSFDFKPGDVVLAVDGRRIRPGTDPALILNGPAERDVTLTLAPRQTKKPSAQKGAKKGTKKRAAQKTAKPKEIQVRVKAASFATARNLVGAAELQATRNYVHTASKGRLGYLNIDAMNMPSFWLFQKEVFSEGYGRDGLIIDVRNNGGGNTADKVLAILVGADHARVHSRDFDLTQVGYPLSRWERPLWSKPIVVMCNENSASNAEILTHAVQSLKRGRVVGMPTGGNVISTWGRSLLDFGTLRDPHRGWHLQDGTDMEWHGAVPDIIVKNDPADLVKGRDAQLDAAIKALAEDVEKYKQAETKTVCRPVSVK